MKKRYFSFALLSFMICLFCTLSVSAYSKSDIQAQLISILYGGSGGYVSCDFDGYSSNTPGRHEGIDIAYHNGAAVYALCDGVITNVVNGYEGSGGLSTIAIYYAPLDKTVIYLHTSPLSSLYIGQVISRGQQIATQSWRGVSVSSSGHTHVEVRNGWAQYAHKSVNDYTLENEDPYPFWEVVVNPLPYPPVNLGDSFYAYIRHQNKQVYLTEESNSIYGRSFKGTTDQIWGFYRQPNGAYAIVNSGNNGCIDVLASSTEGGATVYTYTGGYEGLPNQEFYIFYEYGAYYFSPVHSNGNNMLDMSETTFKVELWGQGRDWSPQEFDIYIIPTVNGQYPANVGTDIYAYIRHINKNVYLTNQLNNIAGEPFTGESKQVWLFRRMANGSYVIENDYNGACMDVLAASTEGGGNVYAYDGGYENLANQRFYIYRMFGGYYFSPEHSNGNNMLDMSESTYNLEIWGVSDTEWSPQQFMLDTVKYSIQYDANGGTNAPALQYKNHRQNISLSNAIPSRDWYVFKGWAASSGAAEPIYQPGDIYSQNASITLYAVWEEMDLSVLVLPASLQTIDEEAFEGITAEKIIIPATCRSIGSRAFANCPNLKIITFESGGGNIEVASDFLEGSGSPFIDISDGYIVWK